MLAWILTAATNTHPRRIISRVLSGLALYRAKLSYSFPKVIGVMRRFITQNILQTRGHLSRSRVKLYFKRFKQARLFNPQTTTVARLRKKYADLASVIIPHARKINTILATTSLKERPAARKGHSSEPIWQTNVATQINTSMLARFLGLGKIKRLAHFLVISHFQYLRRYVLSLDYSHLSLLVRGAVRTFRACMRALIRPTNFMYMHPGTQRWVLDIRVPSSVTYHVSAVEDFIKTKLWWNVASLGAVNPVSPAGEISDPLLLTAIAQTADFFLRKRRRLTKLQRKSLRSFSRYRLHWGRIFFVHSVAHSFSKRKRMRSVKKRRVKQLVRATKCRFWLL